MDDSKFFLKQYVINIHMLSNGNLWESMKIPIAQFVRNPYICSIDDSS